MRSDRGRFRARRSIIGTAERTETTTRMPNTPRRDAMKPQIDHLRELIDALDRRVPMIERAGEEGIARDAAALKQKALSRLAELETEREDGSDR